MFYVQLNGGEYEQVRALPYVGNEELFCDCSGYWLVCM